MPSTILLTRYQGLEALELVAPDGARAVLLLHGAHLVSWIPAGGREQLYLSPKAEFASGQAIRGGVPVCFPQFAGRGPLQKHGFARTRPWQLIKAEQGDDDALAVLRLTDNDASRMVWPHAFELELCVRVSGQMLEMELSCENKGDTAFEFTAALHTYLGVNELDDSSLLGLAGLHYLDSVSGEEHRQRNDLLLPGSPGLEDLDRIYFNARHDLTLREIGITATRELLIGQQGFEDVVVWNPGADKCAALPDMPADGYRHMLCVEAASVGRPVRLEPGQDWAGMQTLMRISDKA